jgi:hypothetical protein
MCNLLQGGAWVASLKGMGIRIAAEPVGIAVLWLDVQPVAGLRLA